MSVKAGTEQYVCGKIDMGNGLFKDKMCTRDVYENRERTEKVPIYRLEPVYAAKYVYTIMRWTPDRTAQAQGNNKQPYWPKDLPIGDVWREGKKTETYTVQLKTQKHQNLAPEVDFETWQRYNVGDTIAAKKDALGNVTVKWK